MSLDLSTHSSTQRQIDDKLDCLNQLDGRYFEKTQLLRPIFSERGLILYRIKTEVLYLNKLIGTLFPDLKEDKNYKIVFDNLGFLHSDLNYAVLRVKNIEAIINHDVKSVEYYIKETLDQMVEKTPELKNIVQKIKPFVHFGLTSQDITTVSL